MAKRMKGASMVLGVCFLLALTFYLLFPCSILLTLSITLGVAFYHFFMRLLVGSIVDGIFHNRMNYRARWFSSLPFEKKLYSFLKVKKWKKRLPTYAPHAFSMKEHSLEELAMATCQAEVVHEIIILLSFLPIVLAIPFGTFPVFFGTSVCSALIDTLFVMIQRTNRPVLVYLIDKKKKD